MIKLRVKLWPKETLVVTALVETLQILRGLLYKIKHTINEQTAADEQKNEGAPSLPVKGNIMRPHKRWSYKPQISLNFFFD